MRQFIVLLAAFTIGAMACEIKNLRKGESIEHAYHTGYDAGYNDGSHFVTQRVEEDSPHWDCQTMGNKRCQ